MNNTTRNTEKINQILKTFETNLPKKPYCTDDLVYGLKIRNAETAITKRFIQPNSPTDLRWLVYDVDRPTAHFDWDEVHAPAPNLTVMNPENGHAHLLYGLEVPVYTHMTAQKNPIRYAASVDIALTGLLEADQAYSKLICKNPLHDSWNTKIWRNESYNLGELADWLDLSKYQDQRRKLPDIGLGRNCSLFDLTRFFAYREIRKPTQNYLFDEMYTEEDFIDRCIAYAEQHNDFTAPLPDGECNSIGKSIGRWVYRHMSSDGFRQWAENRRMKSIQVRSQRSEERRAEALILLSAGLTKIEIANQMNLSYRQILRLLNF